MACDGKVLHEVESMPPSQTTQNTPEDATWKERHGMCVEIGHDHFPILVLKIAKGETLQHDA